MSKRRERKAATYRVAAHLMAEEIYRAKGEVPVTVDQLDRDDYLGVHIPGELRESVAPWAHTQVKHVFKAEG